MLLFPLNPIWLVGPAKLNLLGPNEIAVLLVPFERAAMSPAAVAMSPLPSAIAVFLVPTAEVWVPLPSAKSCSSCLD